MAKFGEYTLQGFLRAKQQKQEQEEFNRKMSEEQRKSNLMFEVQRMQELRLAQQERNRVTREGIGVRTDLTEVVPETPGAVSGGILSRQYGDLFDPNKFYAKPTKPEGVLLRTETTDGQVADIYGYRSGESEVITNIDRSNVPSDKQLTPYQSYQISKDKETREEKEIARGEEAAKQLGTALDNLRTSIEEVRVLRSVPVKSGKQSFLGIDELDKDEPDQVIYNNKAYETGDFERSIVAPKRTKALLYANKLIREKDLGDAVKLIESEVKNGTPLENALIGLKQGTPDLTDEELEILESYFYVAK